MTDIKTLVSVKALEWRAYGNQHLSGWQGMGKMGALYYITDTGPDGEGKGGWWYNGEWYETPEAAKAAAQADYEARILSSLSPSREAGEATVTLTKSQMDGLLRAAFPFATAEERQKNLSVALATPPTTEPEVSTLKAEVERMRKASEWQPIKTAPRDGDEILAWFPCLKLNEDGDLTDHPVDEPPFGGRAIVAWEGGCWSEPDWLSASGSFFDDDFEYAPGPTLWQPLPAPPALHEVEEG